jgi:hypothetical protein
MRGERVAEDLGGDVGVGRAARVGEHAGVVRLRRRSTVNSEPLGEPARHQGGVQSVLEREAHAEVRREAQRADHFGSAYLLLASGCIVCHAATVPQLMTP